VVGRRDRWADGRCYCDHPNTRPIWGCFWACAPHPAHLLVGQCLASSCAGACMRAAMKPGCAARNNRALLLASVCVHSVDTASQQQAAATAAAVVAACELASAADACVCVCRCHWAVGKVSSTADDLMWLSCWGLAAPLTPRSYVLKSVAGAVCDVSTLPCPAPAPVLQ
jgi:hypothetical protein